MADDKENKQTFSIGAFDLPTAEKYVRFLDKHTSFGGHTGLPKEMRNKNPNHSLDFSLGIYQTVDVYAVPPNKCVIGSVVNFVIDNDYNPEGVTYVYPCNNTDAPMGYMISNASAEVIGICVVHGVLEVPLVYPKNTPHSEVEKKDYVQYNIEYEAFEFADSGYPVFNVYQDADGDWIAIILFGGEKGYGAGDIYDGPFATKVIGHTTVDLLYASTDSTVITGFTTGSSYPALIVSVNEGRLNCADNSSFNSSSYGDYERLTGLLIQGGSSFILPEDFGVYYIQNYGANFNFGSHIYDSTYSGATIGVYSEDMLYELYSGGHHKSSFILHIADNVSGQVKQYVYGDVNDIPYYYTPRYALSAGSASEAPYRGHFAVVFQGGSVNDELDSIPHSGDVVIDEDNHKISCFLNVCNNGSDNLQYYSGGVPQNPIGILREGDSNEYVRVYYDFPSDEPSIVLDTTVASSFWCAGVFLYKEVTSSPSLGITTTAYGVSAIQIKETDSYDALCDSAFGSNFYRQLGTVEVWSSEGKYHRRIIQNQFGDIVCPEVVGGTGGTIISSTIIHTSSITNYTISGGTNYVTGSADISGGTTTVLNGNVDVSGDAVINGGTINVEGEVVVDGLKYKGAFAISGSTNSSNVFTASCIDAQSRASGIAGYVISGGTHIPVSANSSFVMPNGACVYLVGNSNQTSFSIVPVTGPTTFETFYTQLAYNSGGSIYQTQFGDVKTLDMPISSGGTGTTYGFSTIVSSNSASIELVEGGTVSSFVIGRGGNNVRIYEGTGGKILIAADTNQYSGGFSVQAKSGSISQVIVSQGEFVLGEYRATIYETETTLEANETLYLEVWYQPDSDSSYSTLTLAAFTLIEYSDGSSIVGAYTTVLDTNAPRYWYKRIAEKDENGVLTQIHITDDIEILGRWS